jgi:hydrogenase-4 component B
MWLPMAAVGVVCLASGLVPQAAIRMLQRASENAVPAMAGPLAPGPAPSLASLVPTTGLSTVLWILTGMLIFGAVMLRHRMGQVTVARGATWGCGYAAPTPRMQYTPTSLSQMLMSLFGWALRPRERRPEIRDLFPREAEFDVAVDDVVLDRGVLPAASKAADRFVWFRWMQQGSSQVYLAYVFVTLVVLFLLR